MSGYLRVYRSRRWKRLWFVVKGKVLYTYKASEVCNVLFCNLLLLMCSAVIWFNTEFHTVRGMRYGKKRSWTWSDRKSFFFSFPDGLMLWRRQLWLWHEWKEQEAAVPLAAISSCYWWDRKTVIIVI